MTKNNGLGVFCLVILPYAWRLVPNPQKKKITDSQVLFIFSRPYFMSKNLLRVVGKMQKFNDSHAMKSPRK